MEPQHKSKMLLNQLAAFRDSGKMIRLQSPVLQQWPWDNGIPLEAGLMGERMRHSFNIPAREPVFVAMVLVSKSF
jgi:hypothetical protein